MTLRSDMKAKREAGIKQDITWSENKDDYLPLRSVEGIIGGQMFWTGYYTTRLRGIQTVSSRLNLVSIKLWIEDP